MARDVAIRIMSEWLHVIGNLLARPAPVAPIKPPQTAKANAGREKARARMRRIDAQNFAAVLVHIRKAKRAGITLHQLTMATGLSINTIDRHVKRAHFLEAVGKLKGAKAGRAALWVTTNVLGKPT